MNSTFHPTHWTLVLNSRGTSEESTAALSQLCEAYYEPVVSFLRREGHMEDEARDLAHGFFQELLKKGIGNPNPDRGKFRNYLLGALKNSLSKRKSALQTIKRGADKEHLSLTTADSEGSNSLHLTDNTLAFDRDWAFELIARALQQLEDEYQSKSKVFEVLRPWLDGNETIPQSIAARELNLSETAVKVAIHRLRVRFRELIRDEISQTVSHSSEISEELQHLIAVVSSSNQQAD